MSAAERTLLGTTHVALHTQHTSALATKAPVLTTTDLFLDTSNNRVGVGLIAPTAKLHVHDTGDPAIKLSRNLSDNYVNINESSFSSTKASSTFGYTFRTMNANPMFFCTSSTERMQIKADGDIEIQGDVNLASGKQYKVNGVALANVDESANFDWTGDHTFTGDISFAEFRRFPLVTITTAHTASSPFPMDKDVGAYLYHNPGNDTWWRLPADAPKSTRILVHCLTEGSQNGQITVTTNGVQGLYKTNSDANKKTSGVVSKKNDKAFYTMVVEGTSGIWTT